MHGDTSPELARAVGVFTTDGTLVVQSWDAWLEAHTGIAAATAIGTPLTTLVPDLAVRKLLGCFEDVLSQGVVAVLVPTFHRYLLRCPPSAPSSHFDTMQQRVTIVPLREDEQITGTIVTIEDVTAQLDRERELAAQLRSADESVRLQAAEALASEAAHEPVPLMNLLGDQQWRVRQAAVAGLGARAGAEQVGEILRAMRDEHQNLALLNSALSVLALTDVDVVAPLIGFLQDQDTDLRIYAALALGDQPDPRAIAALIAALDDPDQNVRFHTIEALGRLRAVEASEPLVAIVASGDFFLAFAAIDALREIGNPHVAPRLVPFLDDEMLCAAVVDALGVLGDDTVVAPLLRLLDTPDAPVNSVVQALATLHERYETLYDDGARIADQVRRSLTPTTTAAIVAALNTATPDELRSLVVVLSWIDSPVAHHALAQLLGKPAVRPAIVEALIRFGAGVTDILVEQLGADDVATRAAAVIALGRIGNPQIVPDLIEILESDPDLAVVTADALAKIGDHRAFEPLLRRIGDSDVAVRQAAISALNSLGHPQLESRIATLLHDPQPVIRESALRIAGYFGYATCADAILGSVEDRDQRVRQAAVEALPYLDDPRCFPLLQHVLRHDTPPVRAAAARTLAHMDSAEAIPALLDALADSDPWVRYFAARSLGQHAQPDTLPALLRLLETDEAGQVRIAAVEALGRIGGEHAVHTLSSLSSAPDADLVRAALQALGHTQHPAALPPLVAALQAKHPLHQTAAIDALATHGGTGAAPALQWIAASSDETIRQAALAALSRIHSSEATAALIELLVDSQQRPAVRTILARKGAAALADFQQGLTHPHPVVRTAIVEILGRIKVAAARELVIAALDDVDPAVRIAAVTVLGRVGYQQALRKLADMAHADPQLDVRRMAQALLGT